MEHWSGPETCAPALDSAALYAAANSQQAAATLINTGAERSHGKVPERLDEALKYAVARIEKDPQSVDAIIRHLGWDGRCAGIEDQLGQPACLPREYVKQIADRATDRLRAEELVPEVVERSISLIERSVPILDVELCKALLNAKLSYVRFACGALVSAAAVFREKSPFEIVRLGRSEGLVKSGTSEGITQLAARAQGLMRSRGCANMLELADDAREIFGSDASQGFIEAAIRTVARFEWLNQEKGWFWYTPDRGQSSNRLVNQIRRMLAVAPRIQLAEIRSALGRDHCFGNFAPPLDVLAPVCKRLLFAHLDGNAVVRVLGLPQWDAILNPNEKTLANVLQEQGPVLGRDEFWERCRERGMNESTFNRCTSRSVILATIRGKYALVGAAIPAGSIEVSERGSERKGSDPGQSASGLDAGHASLAPLSLSAETLKSSLSEGRVVLSWKLHPSSWHSGILRVPEPVNTFVEGEYKVYTVTNRELGVIQIRQRACWDVRRLLQYACSEIDDTLVFVLRLRDTRATAIFGDETIAARIMSGDFDLDAATPDANESAEEQGEPATI